ncbi:DMT family transporter [Actinomyces sp. MRS3W]|uniref:DMT family transporter n=1 Tax=Actinomyces sp. MRS3W TaxID=2800796 RepID=UPI0028FD3E99|nr:SMR family transporter [Actinomyces sp. MRS3W]MDU0349564.1 SMR family transporter [Actinomyces sp. MRS3W]
MEMAWLALVASGLLQAVWATSLAASEGFSLLMPAALFLATISVSAICFSYAVRKIRVVRAYVMWALINALATAAWYFLTGAANAMVAAVALLVVAVGVVAGLQLAAHRSRQGETASTAQKQTP